jgi:hypothetical protein
MAQPNIGGATPGNIVVPLSAIIDQLKGKLSNGEIDALLYAIISKRKTEVRPGDLITADLMNQILNDLADLQVRVAQLEGSAAASGVLKIAKILPAVLRMGDELKVFGSGLAPAQLKSLSIEGNSVPLSALKTGSNAALLIFDVPPILGIPDAGKNVVLAVENTAGASDFGTFYVLPGIATNLEASFNVQRTTVAPGGNTTANTNYDYTFSIEAFTSRDETYTLEPKLAGAANDWSVAVKSGSNELFIPKSQPTPSTTPVVLAVRTGASGSGQLSLGLRAKNFAGVTGSSMVETVAIGVAPPLPNLDVEFLSPTVQGNVQKFSAGTLYVRIDANVNNQRAIISPLNVRLKQPGIYDIGTPVVSDAKWTVTVNNSPRQFNTTGQPNSIQPLILDIRAAAGAPDADVEIPVTGQGGLPDGSFKFAVKLRSDPSNPLPL